MQNSFMNERGRHPANLDYTYEHFPLFNSKHGTNVHLLVKRMAFNSNSIQSYECPNEKRLDEF